MAKSVLIQVRLPDPTADEVRKLAKLAGLSPESVIKLAIALEVRRWQKHDSEPSPPPHVAAHN